MAVFLQLLFINLAISCDNVGVIALASQNLEAGKAAAARRIGIWLSLALKLVFIAIIGYLFGIPWLHIRIVGGVLLLYLTFNMLRQSVVPHPHSRRRQGAGSFSHAIAAIVAADAGMSLDNVIALLSIVSSDGQPPDAREMLLILGALLASVPVLLWFSGTVTRLMERSPLLICLCAGYLAYTAVKMLFEDELLVYFFRQIDFGYTGTAAVCCGVLTAVYGLLTGRRRPFFPKVGRQLLPFCTVVAGYSVVSVLAIAFLATNPVVDGRILSVQAVYGFEPCGANAVFALAAASELPVLCTAIYCGVAASGERDRWKLLRAGCGSMLLFIGLELAIATAGMTTLFGFGTLRPLPYLGALLAQAALLCSYAAVFSVITFRARGKLGAIALCVLYMLAESIATAVCLHSRVGRFFAGFLPSGSLALLPRYGAEPLFWLRGVVVSAVIVQGCVWLTRQRESAPAASPKTLKAKIPLYQAKRKTMDLHSM